MRDGITQRGRAPLRRGVPGNRNRKNRNRIQKNTTINFTLILSMLIILMGAVTFLLWTRMISNGAEALKKNYAAAYVSGKEETYQEQYKKYFEKAKKDYHVANRVEISIGELKEKAALEVLKVTDVEYVVETSDNNNTGISSWLEVPGEGTYIVDLQAAEFIVDNERSHVLVRVPYPQMTNIAIDYKNVKKLLFKNDIFNESYSVGEELAKKQLNKGDMLIKKEFASNQHFYLSAQNAARTNVECLVKQFNPEVSDLDVEVEFY